MFPGGYMPFQYGDGKSLIEASVIIIMMMKNDKRQHCNPIRERKCYTSNMHNLKTSLYKTKASLF